MRYVCKLYVNLTACNVYQIYRYRKQMIFVCMKLIQDIENFATCFTYTDITQHTQKKQLHMKYRKGEYYSCVTFTEFLLFILYM